MKKQHLADLVLLSIAFIWGSTFVIVQRAIEFIPPNFFNGIRFLIGSLCLSLLLIGQKKDSLFNGALMKNGILLGTFLFCGYSFQTVGLMLTTSSKAGFITGLNVMIVPFLASLILKEKLRATSIFCAIIGTIGLYLLAGGSFHSFQTGDFLVLLCAFAFAVHIVLTGALSKQFPVLPLTIIQLLTVSLLSFLSAMAFEPTIFTISIRRLFTFDVAFALLMTSLLATAYAYVAQTKYQAFTSPSRVAMIFATEPVFAAITAFFWQGERLSATSAIGCLFIFIAMILSEAFKDPFSRWKKSKSEAA